MNIHQKRKMLIFLFGNPAPMSYPTVSWDLASHLQRMYTGNKLVKQWVNFRLINRDYSKETGQISCKPMLDYVLHKKCYSGYRNWIWKYSIIYHISPDIAPSDNHIFQVLGSISPKKRLQSQEDAKVAFSLFQRFLFTTARTFCWYN